MRKFSNRVTLIVLLLFATGLHAGDLVKRRVLLLDFANVSKNPNYDYLKESLADNLKTELIKTKSFEVIDQRTFETLFPGVIATQKLTPESASQLATDANCEAVVFGKFVVAGQKIRINAQAVDAISTKPVAAEKADGSVTSEIFQTIDAVVNPLTAGMVANLGAIERDKVNRRKDVEEKISSITTSDDLGKTSSGHQDQRFTVHSQFLYSLPLPKMDTYIGGGFGGQADIAFRVNRYLYPYIQTNAYFSSGKGTIASMLFYSVEGGFTYPITLNKLITLSPYFAAGITGGNLVKLQTNSFLLASFNGGLHLDISLTKMISISLSASYSYIPDPLLPMSFALISAGLGVRF